MKLRDTQRPEKYYVVPAMLSEKTSSCDFLIEELTNEPGDEHCICRWDFSISKWLPRHLFEQLMCIIVTLDGHKLCSGMVRDEAVTGMARDEVCTWFGDALLILRLHADNWSIEAQTVKHEGFPNASQWMLNLVNDEIKKILKRLQIQLKFRVFVTTLMGNVEMSVLRNAGNMVRTSHQKIISRDQLKKLKEKWLCSAHETIDNSNTCICKCRHSCSFDMPPDTASCNPNALAACQ